MRTTNIRMAGLISASALAIGLVAIVQPAVAGISNTKHNLSTGGTGSAHTTVGTAEICVFCHTPHASNTAMSGAPLWNKASTGNTYQNYGASSVTFEALPNQPGAVSLACLTCHDGTQAMDNIINAPNVGIASNYNVSGQAGGIQANGRAYTWTTTGAADATGFLSTSAVANLATDLRNDHPIGMNYCAAATDGTGAACVDTDFYSATVSGKAWISTDLNSTFEKTDMPLFSGSSTAGTRVECATCHDPHTETATFLRMSGGNTGSQVCLACHIK